jgi:hypothetical protein
MGKRENEQLDHHVSSTIGYTGLDDPDSEHPTKSSEQGARADLDTGQGKERLKNVRPEFKPAH